jgi:hypothetical protein
MATYSIVCSLLILSFAIIMTFITTQYEAFIGSPDAKECGVDRPPCKGDESCLNGWCVSSNPPHVPASTGLPVYP